ncbi:AAA family ATPase [Pseudoalteromonas neustonica]|uniref:AAA family ATPase n=1 Tax=Pseudoalteromonas neustonica TaxID=1840331 RepID=A0ABU9TZQ8_9GAMM
MQSQILPSRAALVDRIALQFEYGQSLIALLGSSGLGKSYLLETFITDKYSDFNKAFVQLSARMTDVQLMGELLEQSFRAPLIDQNLSLSENFYQLAKQQNCGACLWVLDGGRHLSDEMAEELVKLAKQSPTTLYILVATQVVAQFSSSVEIHLEALSIAESKQLMSWYFKDLPINEDPVFQTFLHETHGNPSLLLAWEPTLHSAKVEPKAKPSWPIHLVTLMLIIMLLIIGFLYQSDMTRWWKDVYQAQPEQAIPTALSVNTFKSGAEDRQNTDVITLADNTDSDQLLVDESIETKSSKVNAIANDTPIELDAIESPSATHKNNVAAILDSLAISEQKKDPVNIVEQPSKVIDVSIAELPADNAWYLSQTDNNVVIQLLAVTQQSVSEQFIAQQQLQANAKVYQTWRNEKLWWVVTYGNYPSMQAARAVLPSLPEQVRKNQPFYKKIAKIKQEIALLDQ